MDRLIRDLMPDRAWEVAALAQARMNALRQVNLRILAGQGDENAARMAMSEAFVNWLVGLTSNPKAMPCMECRGEGAGTDSESGLYTCERCEGAGVLEPASDEIAKEENEMTPTVTKPTKDLAGDAGDAWLRTLKVEMAGAGGTVVVDGYRFEELATAIGIRHLMMHPRTRDVIESGMPGDRLKKLIESRWSGVDSYGIADLATSIQHICGEGDVTWKLS